MDSEFRRGGGREMGMDDKALTVGDALSMMQSAGWQTNAESSSMEVHTLESRTGAPTIIIIGSPDAPISGEAAERIRDRVEAAVDTDAAQDE